MPTAIQIADARRSLHHQAVAAIAAAVRGGRSLRSIDNASGVSRQTLTNAVERRSVLTRANSEKILAALAG